MYLLEVNVYVVSCLIEKNDLRIIGFRTGRLAFATPHVLLPAGTCMFAGVNAVQV